MILVPSLADLLQPLSGVLTAPSFISFQTPNRPWHPHKPHAPFADMLATLRCRLMTSLRKTSCKPSSTW